MRGKSIAGASVGAIVSALLTLGCCLPLPLIGALGAASASLFLAKARLWLLAFSVLLLALGIVQVIHGMKCRVRQGRTALVLLGLAVVIVMVTALFPQLLAGWIADASGGK